MYTPALPVATVAFINAVLPALGRLICVDASIENEGKADILMLYVPALPSAVAHFTSAEVLLAVSSIIAVPSTALPSTVTFAFSPVTSKT